MEAFRVRLWSKKQLKDPLIVENLPWWRSLPTKEKAIIQPTSILNLFNAITIPFICLRANNYNKRKRFFKKKANAKPTGSVSIIFKILVENIKFAKTRIWIAGVSVMNHLKSTCKEKSFLPPKGTKSSHMSSCLTTHMVAKRFRKIVDLRNMGRKKR